MAFMEKEIVYGDWIEVDGNNGTDFIPADLVGALPDKASYSDWDDPEKAWLGDAFERVMEYTENTRVNEISERKGYGARLSAPGYMDCTEWCVFDTEKEAEEYLEEMYGNEDDEDESNPAPQGWDFV